MFLTTVVGYSIYMIQNAAGTKAEAFIAKRPALLAALGLAILVAGFAYYFGVHGMPSLFGQCSYSQIPFFIVLGLSVLAVMLAAIPVVQFCRGKDTLMGVLSGVVLVTCMTLGVVGCMAAAFIFCF